MHFYQVDENGAQAYAFGLITKHHSHQTDKNAYQSSYLQITNNVQLLDPEDEK
jgi:hypothetical protein